MIEKFSSKDLPLKTEKLGEGVSTGWEKEHTFTAEQVMAAIKELDPKAGDLKVIKQTFNHEGILVLADMRAPDSASGYSFMLKGKHGSSASSVTAVDRVDYAGSSSDDVEYAEVIAEYKNDAWVKQ